MWQVVLTCVELQGAFILVLLGTGWLLIGRAKLLELRRRSSPQATWDIVSRCQAWPGVAVVMPLRGCRKHNVSNLRSQISQDYSGVLEYYLVVDSKSDPAYLAAQGLLDSMHGPANVKLMLSGQCHNQSQKLCNIQAGIKAASPQLQYVLCVDDDVSLHPSTIRECVTALLLEKEAFMLTGYPFDVPRLDSGQLVYAALTYHLPLLIGFCLPETHFVWGGFMLMPLHALREDWYGIMKAWSNGGYSDDLIVAAKCSEHGLKILSPPYAIFPQWMEGPMTWSQYWNYLHRQLYVMDTYCNDANKRLNHTMMALHPYLSLAFVIPTLTVAFRTVSFLSSQTHQMLFSTVPEEHKRQNSESKLHVPWTSAIFLLAFAYAVYALRWMTGVVLRLFTHLSPRGPQHLDSHYHWIKMWLGFFLNNLLLPLCMLYTAFCPTVVWSGIEYQKWQGKVSCSHAAR